MPSELSSAVKSSRELDWEGGHFRSFYIYRNVLRINHILAIAQSCVLRDVVFGLVFASYAQR